MNFSSYAIFIEIEFIYSVKKYFFSNFYVSVRILGARNTEMNMAHPLIKNLWPNNHINCVDDHVSNMKIYIRRWRWASGCQEPVCHGYCWIPSILNRSGILKKLSKYLWMNLSTITCYFALFYVVLIESSIDSNQKCLIYWLQSGKDNECILFYPPLTQCADIIVTANVLIVCF